MNDFAISFHGQKLVARPSGTLWWPDVGLLCVSDLHLGKAERIARRGGTMLPPYEGHDTLARLEVELDATQARHVVCLGDSFDDPAAATAFPNDLRSWLERLILGRTWVWVEGNHDPGPNPMPGRHLAQYDLHGLTFRHEARVGASGEISGHYHPKARLKLRGTSVIRPCFLIDDDRVILPAFGTFTGGLLTNSEVFRPLMGPKALSVLTGTACHAVPMARSNAVRT
ncbi:ligase-associated DNA damage response endonuclease PdeM [Pseudoruegeria sp. SK021]|uniref:ligase-associated DNA damage response endonuclease PdeM n=1 Tax=Pseudoruegeria sp. SK021 TaxID=1933035 RepID=UPI000A25E833|nr:ligase-associated DNA damage response endonuclease PdeM [Pseudoruegeria sp. SK021]OSP56528.1 metallophosphoesterase [Pseudoruegeria sp. SK021]